MLEKIEDYTKRAYATACKHGFHDEELSEQHLLMLVITEVSEMVEADRKGRSRSCAEIFEDALRNVKFTEAFEVYMKDSVPDEMADVCIRLFDLLGVLNKEERIEFDLLKVIVTNQKKVIGYDYMSFTERAFALCNILTSRSSVERVICRALAFVVKWAQDKKIDLDWHIKMKMRYNELRENKHGKKY